MVILQKAPTETWIWRMWPEFGWSSSKRTQMNQWWVGKENVFYTLIKSQHELEHLTSTCITRKWGGEEGMDSFKEITSQILISPPSPLPPPIIVMLTSCLRHIGFPSHLSFHNCYSTLQRERERHIWYFTPECENLWGSKERDNLKCCYWFKVHVQWHCKKTSFYKSRGLQIFCLQQN